MTPNHKAIQSFEEVFDTFVSWSYIPPGSIRKAYKVIIAGGIYFNDYKLLYDTCNSFFETINEEIEIVSETVNKIDRLVEKYAKEKGYNLTQFPVDWIKYGEGAGYIRNCKMATYSDFLIAFWDSKSRGIKHMIEITNKKN